MNEKFWDLKKSRQDNMINGALKVFARDGFRHASTDEIVTEASISKGLLFHYFHSKVGLYEFLTEYCARFALVELRSELGKRDVFPFFDLQHRLTAVESAVMRKYPYLFLFFEKVYSDEKPEALINLGIWTQRRDALIDSAVYPGCMTEEEAFRIDRLIRLARLDTAGRILKEGDFSAEKYTSDMVETIGIFEK